MRSSTLDLKTPCILKCHYQAQLIKPISWFFVPPPLSRASAVLPLPQKNMKKHADTKVQPHNKKRPYACVCTRVWSIRTTHTHTHTHMHTHTLTYEAYVYAHIWSIRIRIRIRIHTHMKYIARTHPHLNTRTHTHTYEAYVYACRCDIPAHAHMRICARVCRWGCVRAMYFICVCVCDIPAHAHMRARFSSCIRGSIFWLGWFFCSCTRCRLRRQRARVLRLYLRPY